MPLSNARDALIPIGLLDTGADGGHPMLRGKISRFTTIDTRGNAVVQPRAWDTGSHGTHTAGIICGEGAFSAADVKLRVIAVPERGRTLLNLVAGMEAMINCEVKIACLPLGVQAPSPLLMDLAGILHRRGTLVIAAVGNSGGDCIDAPAAHPDVLAVGAVDDNGRVAAFSATGRGQHPGRYKPDILAPGVKVSSALPGGQLKTRSGTSMACAYVARIAGWLLQAQPRASAGELKRALLQTARPLSPTSPAQLSRTPHGHCRAGIVQPQDALDYLTNNPSAVGSGTESQRPAWSFAAPYIDPFLVRKYRRAGQDEALESMVSGGAVGELLAQSQKRSGTRAVLHKRFDHGDIRYISAPKPFYTALFNQPGLAACSATRIDPLTRGPLNPKNTVTARP